MLVKNNWKRPIRVGRQVIAKDAVADVPEHLLIQPRLQKMRSTGKLVFPYREEKPEIVKSTPMPLEVNKTSPAKAVPMPTVDNLTDLPQVGAGRAKALNDSGIYTFAQVVARTDDLRGLLDITKQQVADIVEDAKSKVG